MGLKKNQPSISPKLPRVSNHNPSIENDIDVTKLTLKSSYDPISTN